MAEWIAWRFTVWEVSHGILASYHCFMHVGNMTVMLAAKRLAGVAPQANLRNILHTGKKAHKPGIHPGFETQGRHLQKSKQGYQWPHKKDSCLPKFKKQIPILTLLELCTISSCICSVIIVKMYSK